MPCQGNGKGIEVVQVPKFDCGIPTSNSKPVTIGGKGEATNIKYTGVVANGARKRRSERAEASRTGANEEEKIIMVSKIQ